MAGCSLASPLPRPGPRPQSYLFIVFPSTKPVPSAPFWRAAADMDRASHRASGSLGPPHPPPLAPRPPRAVPRPRKLRSHGPPALDVPLASLEGKGQPRANPHSPTPIACSSITSPPYKELARKGGSPQSAPACQPAERQPRAAHPAPRPRPAHILLPCKAGLPSPAHAPSPRIQRARAPSPYQVGAGGPGVARARPGCHGSRGGPHRQGCGRVWGYEFAGGRQGLWPEAGQQEGCSGLWEAVVLRQGKDIGAG
ncbi:hypothetical protein P7K49_009667 [Saguinus oedipus]|uniref:Basic proline-rich protein-like n=1 Tax=Saguinus oedipus TaxID=9490 RepID=A0ABQ9VKM0_SAGOE|nr:hypothetical protein P7K49_009667 [Saguinus oedipus]